jgi:hypothetical protein
MPRVDDISDKFFNRDGSDVTLKEFTSRLLASETRPGEISVRPTSKQDYVVNGKSVYGLLTDRGNGRVYDGLKSLELMSRQIKGVGSSSHTLFDATIIAFSADDMRNSTPESAARIVNVNLGMVEVVVAAVSTSSYELEKYNSFVNKIAREIRAGGFSTEDNIAEALVRVKALINSVIHKVIR